MKTDSSLIKQDVLFAVHSAKLEGEVLSGRVRGYSPSGNYVLIDADWYAVEKVTVLEVLPMPAQSPAGDVEKIIAPFNAGVGTTAAAPAPATMAPPAAPGPMHPLPASITSAAPASPGAQSTN